MGDLGSGKTTFVQGITAGWGSLDAVSSPTFVLVNMYRRPPNHVFYHLDAYRLSGPAEAEDLDLDQLIEGGPLVIEWADRIQKILPSESLKVTLEYIDVEQRDLLFHPHGVRYDTLLTALRRQVFGIR